MLPLYSTASIRRAPVMTSLLVAANLAAFAWQIVVAVGAGEASLEAFMTTHALVPGRMVAGYASETQWQTVLTHMFLHGGFAHLLGNLWFLWVFGRSVEDRLGSFGFLLVYLLSGFGAAGLQVLVDPASKIPMLGASGAVSGVLGAYLVLMPGAWVLALVPWVVPVIPVPAFVFLLLWFLIQMWNGMGSLLSSPTAAGGVAWWAHAGGFVAGMCLVMLAGPTKRRK